MWKSKTSGLIKMCLNETCNNVRIDRYAMNFLLRMVWNKATLNRHCFSTLL